MSMSVYLDYSVTDKSPEEIKEIWKRIEYEETDAKVLLHNHNELQQKDYERNKELRDWELKQ